MKHWKLIFPFTTTKEIPHDIEARLSQHAFDSLPDGQNKASGFALLTESERFIKSDGRHLFLYCEQSRKADAYTVNHIYQERLQKVKDEGREVTEETAAAVRELAEREAVKFAKINHLSVYILYDFHAGKVWCAGSTVKKCEAALKRLRRVLGSLDTEPVVFPLAGRQLASRLRHRTRALTDDLLISDGAKLVAVEREGDSKVTFDGVSLLDEHVGEVLRDLTVRTTDMDLYKSGKRVASFVLDVPENAGISLRALDYGSGTGGKDDEAEQSHAADMQIVAKTCEHILSSLQHFTHGTGV